MAAFTSSSTHSCGKAQHLPGSARTPRAQGWRVAEGFCSFVIYSWRLPHWLSTATFSVLKTKVGGCAHVRLMTSFVMLTSSIFGLQICSVARWISECWKYCIVSCCESYTAANSTLKLLFIVPIQRKLMHFEEVRQNGQLLKLLKTISSHLLNTIS